jgi:photoactive yellow protein
MASSLTRSPQSLPFHAPKLGAWLDSASRADLDALSFGAIEVDDDGAVVFYNRYESEFTGFAPGDVVGRSFFTDVAPCTHNPLFFGRFRAGLEEEEYDASLRYTLTYRLRPTLVNVRIVRYNDRNWILVSPHTARDTVGSRLAISRRIHAGV